jgi:hypothetical protein
MIGYNLSNSRTIYFLFSPAIINVVSFTKIPSYTRFCFAVFQGVYSRLSTQLQLTRALTESDNKARRFNEAPRKYVTLHRVTMLIFVLTKCDMVWKQSVEPVPFFAVASGVVSSFASRQWHWCDDGKITLNSRLWFWLCYLWLHVQGFSSV